MKKPKKLIKFTKDRPGHDFRYSLDSSKIKKELKWKIKNNFEDGIKKTIEWYIENPELIANLSVNELTKIKWKTR
jgi:dTDP-glucose 4,6-dehydratase